MELQAQVLASYVSMEPQIGIRGRPSGEYEGAVVQYYRFNGAPDRNPGKGFIIGRFGPIGFCFNGAPDRNPGKVEASIISNLRGIRFNGAQIGIGEGHDHGNQWRHLTGVSNGAPDRNPKEGR